MRALVECSEKEIFDKVRRLRALSARHTHPLTPLLQHQITAGDETASFAAERVEIMLQEGARLDLRTRAQCLAHLGKHFRPVRWQAAHTVFLRVMSALPTLTARVVTGPGRFPSPVRRGCRRAAPPRRHLRASHLEARQAEPAGAHAAQAVRTGASLRPRVVQEKGEGCLLSLSCIAAVQLRSCASRPDSVCHGRPAARVRGTTQTRCFTRRCCFPGC
jgi:hypothetical protein